MVLESLRSAVFGAPQPDRFPIFSSVPKCYDRHLQTAAHRQLNQGISNGLDAFELVHVRRNAEGQLVTVYGGQEIHFSDVNALRNWMLQKTEVDLLEVEDLDGSCSYRAWDGARYEPVETKEELFDRISPRPGAILKIVCSGSKPHRGDKSRVGKVRYWRATKGGLQVVQFTQLRFLVQVRSNMTTGRRMGCQKPNMWGLGLLAMTMGGIACAGPAVAINQSPSFTRPLPDITVQMGASINWTLPSDSFVDPDGDALWVSATGPSWLNITRRPPALLGTFSNPRTFPLQSTAVVGDMAVHFSNRLDTFNVSDPSNPRPMGSWDGTGNIYEGKLSRDGLTAFIVDTGYELRAINLTNPWMPSHMGMLIDTGRRSVTVDDARKIVWVGEFPNIVTVNVSDPTNMQFLGTRISSQGIYEAGASALSLYREGTALHAFSDGWHVLNGTDPLDLRRVHGELVGPTNGIAVQDNLVMVGRQTAGGPLLMYDATNVLAPTLLATLPIDSGSVLDVVASGPFVAVLTTLGAHTTLVDRRNLTAPSIYAQIPKAGTSPLGITFDGQRLLITESGLGVRIFDFGSLSVEGVAPAPGAYPVEITLDDGRGGRTQQQFQINVPGATTGAGSTGTPSPPTTASVPTSGAASSGSVVSGGTGVSMTSSTGRTSAIRPVSTTVAAAVPGVSGSGSSSDGGLLLGIIIGITAFVVSLLGGLATALGLRARRDSSAETPTGSASSSSTASTGGDEVGSPQYNSFRAERDGPPAEAETPQYNSFRPERDGPPAEAETPQYNSFRPERDGDRPGAETPIVYADLPRVDGDGTPGGPWVEGES